MAIQFTTLKQAFELTSKMSSVRRFSMEKMMREENVLTHTGEVVLFAYLMGMALTRAHPGCLSIELLLRRAAVHDIDEIHTGDIPRPTKERVSDAMNEIASEAVDNMGAAYSNDSLAWDWTHAKQGAEGTIIALADHLAAMHRIAEEILTFGNHSMMHVGLRQDDIMEKRFNAAKNALPLSCHWVLSYWYEEEKSLIKAIRNLGGRSL
jgi:5'-deoxynucleotidase YfbR-like HD superfamily hydrolase